MISNPMYSQVASKAQTALDPDARQEWIFPLSWKSIFSSGALMLCAFFYQKLTTRPCIVLGPAVDIICCAHDQSRFVRAVGQLVDVDA